MNYLKIVMFACSIVLLGSACSGDKCEEAAEIIERCGNSSGTNNGTNGGVTVTTTSDFDENACKDDDNAKDYADCIVENEDNICDGDGSALLGCALQAAQ